MLPVLVPVPDRFPNSPKLNALSANGLRLQLLAHTLARTRISGHNGGREVSMTVIAARIQCADRKKVEPIQRHDQLGPTPNGSHKDRESAYCSLRNLRREGRRGCSIRRDGQPGIHPPLRSAVKEISLVYSHWAWGLRPAKFGQASRGQ